MIADVFDFFAGEMSGAVGDLESVFGGAVDEVSSSGEVVGEVLILVDEGHDFWGGAVAVFANEAIDFRIFAKFFHFWCEDGELSSCGDGHAGSVNGFIAEPSGMKFGGIEITDDALGFFIELSEVDLYGEVCGGFERGGAVANVETTGGEAAVGATSNYGLDVEGWEFLTKEFFCLIEDATEGGVGFPHHAFHAIGCSDEVGFVDPGDAAGADEEVFVAVGHADDFVRNHLTDRNDQVVSTVPDEFVELSWPRFVPDAFGDFAHVFGGDFADGDDVVSPAVRSKERVWDGGKHLIELGGRHGDVCAESGKDVFELVAVVVENFGSQETGSRVKAGEIRGDGEDVLARTNLG